MCARSLARTGDSVPRKDVIFIVETDELIRELLERWLAEAGFVVRTGPLNAASPGDGAGAPSLIILNVPHPRGAEALVRTLEREHRAPVLVVSGRFRRGLGGSVEAARRLGVRKVLPKPFTREELLAAVEESIADPS
jgi:DNA-binding response OmpR family regulator